MARAIGKVPRSRPVPPRHAATRASTVKTTTLSVLVDSSSPRTRKVAIDPMTNMLEGHAEASFGYVAHKDSYAKRLRKIEGQVRGIAKMIDEDKYCIDILTQISAASSALRAVALNLLDEHLDHCVSHALAEGGDEAQAKLSEASAAIARLIRS